MSQSTIAPASQANPPMPADSGADPTQGQDQSQDQGGGFVIILAFQQDGSIQVMQQGGDTGQDDGSQGDQSQPQVVNSLQDAFQAVEQLAQQNGYSGQDDDGDDQGDGNAELGPDDAESAWNKMAAKSDKRRMGGGGGNY